MFQEEFARHVDEGLSRNPKTLGSKYLYDDNGSELFQSIMNMPEYYLTDAEFEILSEKQNNFQAHFQNSQAVEFIELGAGDGFKIIPFLRHFQKQPIDFRYRPVDISSGAIKTLEQRMHQELPGLKIESMNLDYFQALQQISKNRQTLHVYLFLGGNIGNFKPEEALEFLKKIRKNIHRGDLLVIGFDLKKDPRIILKAYDDPYGITASFNLNILKRINHELNANFDISAFRFYPFYYPETGEVKSYLYSLKKQEVRIEALQKSFSFDQFEYIHTEVSRKFALQEIGRMAEQTGFKVVDHVFDCKHYFSDSILKAI